MKTTSIIHLLAAALVFLFAIGWGVYIFIAAILDRLNSMQSDLAKAIIAASASVLVAAISFVAGKLWEQRLKIRDEIRAKKIPIYEKHIATFFKIFFAPKLGGKQPDPKEHMAAFAAFAEQLITWGSSDVIKAWGNFRALNHAATTPHEQIDKLEGLFMAIRKDVGNDVRSLKRGDLLRLFVTDERGEGN